MRTDRTAPEKTSRHMLLPLLICIGLLLCSVAAAFCVEKEIGRMCVRIMRDTAEQGADDTRVLLQRKKQDMKTAAARISKLRVLNARSARRILDELEPDELISSFSVLLPGDEMVWSGGKELPFQWNREFAIERHKLADFRRMEEAADGEKYAVYTMPVEQNSSVVCVLYGYINLKDLPSQFRLPAFAGQCQMYLIDNLNGNLLMDTEHAALGNIFDGDPKKQKVKAGGTLEIARRNIAEGFEGYAVYKPENSKDDFYMYYKPVGLYNLTFQITVSRSAAFAEAVHVQRVIYALGIVQAGICVLYGAGVLYLSYRRTRKNNSQLQLNQAANEVQKILFEAYNNAGFLKEALEQTGKALGARQAVFAALEKNTVQKVYSWPEEAELRNQALAGRNIRRDDPVLYRMLQNEKSAIIVQPALEWVLPPLETEAGKRKNFVAARVENTGGEIIGILQVFDAEDIGAARELLELLVGSFQMAQQIMNAYHFLQEKGSVDALTGLKNRNAYQEELAGIRKTAGEGFCCVYIDANGLHDLNNQYGHAVGDRMLRSIGYMIANLFGQANAYRMGGDEFVVLLAHAERNEVEEQLKHLRGALLEREYEVSVGLAFKKPEDTVQQTIQAAEKNMYEDKKAYYSGKKDRRQSRQRNQELESFLMEKKDRDSFLAAIAAAYLGVYAVNLEADNTRVIYRPEYFEQILKLHRYRFRSALREYASIYVVLDDLEAFAAFTDYGRIADCIRKGVTMEFVYRSKHHYNIRLRILPMEDYTEERKNTLWIFEKLTS